MLCDVVALAVKSFHAAVMNGQLYMKGPAVPVEIGHFVFQRFLSLPVLVLRIILFHKVHLHVFVKADGEDRAIQSDFFQGGRDHVLSEDIPGIHFQGARGDTENGISLRVIPGKVFEGYAAVDIGGDGFHRNGAPEHVLPGGGIVENAGGAEAGYFGKDEDQAEKGKKDGCQGQNIGAPLSFSAKSGQLFLHRCPP